jgi:NAD(P)-dependent dehydrogenase (short-subunit alcohol dehydrogenase family)
MKPLVDLTNKNILITGASSGIGQATAVLCSALGAHVILLARNPEKLAATTILLGEGQHLSFAVDVTDSEKLEDVIKEVVQKLGKIDGFVHSAGMEMTRPLKILKREQWNSTLDVNVISGFECARIISNAKYINKAASIIFISSIVGLFGQAGKVAYSASKGALVAGSKSLALELAAKGIRVNAILPAVVETEMSNTMLESIGEEAKANVLKMHPLGFGKPEDVANSCAFLLSEASSWITGTSFIIDGGYSAS